VLVISLMLVVLLLVEWDDRMDVGETVERRCDAITTVDACEQ